MTRPDGLPARCTTPGCGGDTRYAAPGRGHTPGCTYPMPHPAENGLRRGWFADWDDEASTDYGWQPCLETGQGHIPCFQVWFKTKAECEEWIAANVIGVEWFPGDPTEAHVFPPERSDR